MINIKELGRGGFGVVDLVKDATGKQYARKTFIADPRLGAELLANVKKRFVKEVRIQKGIAHRNIVPVLDDDLDAAPPFYLMPVAVSSLDKDLERDRTLSGNYLSAINDIVSGLEEIHSMNIYHRDLKPQNILRFCLKDSNTEGDYYALSDFGLISLKESRFSVLTSTGMANGSDYYTAPEITKDLRHSSIQSDIYSLGCIIHDMVGIEDRIPCNEIREGGLYGGILQGCTRADPDRRFKSARSVLDALLSVGSTADVAAETPQAADFIEKLESDEPLSAALYHELSDFLEYTAGDRDRHAIFMNLSENRIEELCQRQNKLVNLIGTKFSEWVHNTSFPFAYCDGMANRLEIFMIRGDVSTKMECLVSLLEMGTSHNRWYVERKFFNYCGPDMDESLAKRLGIEFRVREDWVCHAIDHLEGSIGISRNQLHPVLVKTLEEICG